MEVKMEDTNKKESSKTKELTREQLMEILNQVSEQDRNLVKENTKLKDILKDMNLTNLFKRLDYLFKIVNSDSSLFSTEFKVKCAKDIEDIMFQEDIEEPIESKE